MAERTGTSARVNVWRLSALSNASLPRLSKSPALVCSSFLSFAGAGAGAGAGPPAGAPAGAPAAAGAAAGAGAAVKVPPAALAGDNVFAPLPLPLPRPFRLDGAPPG